MTKAHETPFTPGQQATVTSRLAVALPGALELLAKSGIGIKAVLTHTKEGDRLVHALAMAIRALYNGHADTIPPSILSPVGIIDLPGAVKVDAEQFRSRPDVHFFNGADSFLPRIRDVFNIEPSRFIRSKLDKSGHDSHILSEIGGDPFGGWEHIPLLLDSHSLQFDRVWVLFVRVDRKDFTVSIGRDWTLPRWNISAIPTSEFDGFDIGAIVLHKS